MAEVNKTILIEYDVKTGKFIDENNKAYKSLKQLIDATKQVTAESQKMGDVIGQNTEVVVGSAKHLRTRIAHLKEQREATSTTSDEYLRQTLVIQRLEKEYADMTKTSSQVVLKQKETAQSTRELAKLQENQARSAGLAGAAAFELGRTISDLPFGIVAVTNNISQLGTLMAALVANAKGVKGALNALGQQLIGPAGILVAFQIVTAAITFFAQQSNKAKKEVESLNLELQSQVEILEEILKLKKQGAITGEEENKLLENYVGVNKDLVKLTKEGVISEREKNDILKQTLELFKLREDDEKAQADRDEERKRINKEILDLEKEQYAALELRHNEQRRGGTDAVLIATITERIQNITDQITAKEAEKADIIREEANAKADIELIEKNINKQLDDAINKQETLLELQKKRQGALSDLLSVQISEEEALVDEAILNEDYKAFQEHFKRLNILKGEQLFQQKELELKDVNDPTTINAIEEKYRILFATLNKEISEGFREGLLKMVGGRLDGTGKDKLSLLRLLEGPEKTDAQKWAEGEVKKIGEAIDGELAKRQASKGARNFFVDTFGVSEENLMAGIEAAQMGLDTIADVFAAQAEREIAIETNRTNKLNDQLKQRLANEQLTAEERDKINQQIARNEAELVAKENEINKKRFEQEKAVNIAMAVVDTFSAATGVLKDTKGGSFARIAGMIAVIGAGLANVAMISKQQFVGKAMPSPSLTAQGASATAASPAFNVVGASSQNQLAAAIAGAESQPVKAYVVSSDVTTAQELERKIVEGASI